MIASSFIIIVKLSGGTNRKLNGVQEVINKPTISRVSELRRLPVTLRQYEFLIDHPRLSMLLAHIYDPSFGLLQNRCQT